MVKRTLRAALVPLVLLGHAGVALAAEAAPNTPPGAGRQILDYALGGVAICKRCAVDQGVWGQGERPPSR